MTVSVLYKHIPKAVHEAVNGYRFDDCCQDMRLSGGYCHTTASHMLKEILMDDGIGLSLEQISAYEQVMRLAYACSEGGLS